MTGPVQARQATTCAYCGHAVRVDIVEKIAVEHLAGVEPTPVLRFLSYCVNQFCGAYREPREAPPRY